MLVVIALGGNALLHRGEPLEADIQQHNIKLAAKAIAEIAVNHDVIVTHGNGPQVGLLALQSAAYNRVQPYPLDVLGAETEGMIGYLLEQELCNHLPQRQVATLLTQVVVDANDSAFNNPSKPIGPIYNYQEAQRLAQERGWTIAPDGKQWQRVVPSPKPVLILELSTIKLLVQAKVLVVCGGGGGIPVIISPTGIIRGVEAVIDKDLAAALLATELEADALLLLTDVDAVYLNWNQPNAEPIDQITPEKIRQYTFAPGSMAPKVEAAVRFVEQTQGIAAIGKLEDAASILSGEKGTLIRVS